MSHRAFGFVALLAVIGVSIVFGMVLGAKLNVPPVMLAASEAGPLELAPAYTQTPLMTDFADIVERAMPAVVSVTSTQVDEDEDEGGRSRLSEPFRFFFQDPDEDDDRGGRPRIGEGSGFFISPDGYMLTNNHVVEGADRVTIGMQDGRTYEARVIGTDPSIDLALLKVDPEEDLPHLPLGDSRSLRVGEWVIAIGNPLDFEQTVTVGVVSAKERRVPIGSTDGGVVSFIQTDAAINFGNSGGPLLDGRGNVIGINTAIRRGNYAEGIGFALPITQARTAVEQLREKGYVSRGFIGITMNTKGIDEEAREIYGLPDMRGVIVQEVTADGPADKAGLRDEDIIRKVNGEVVKDNFDLIGKISAHQPGDTVKLEVFRRGKTLNLEATLGDRQEGLQARAGSRRREGRQSEPQTIESSGLGMTVETLSRSMRDQFDLDIPERGVIVTDVNYNSEAADEGIQPNMIVLSINDEPTRTIDEWEDAMEGLKPGSAVKLYVYNIPTQAYTYFFLRVPRD